MATHSSRPPATELQLIPTIAAAADAVANTLDECLAVLDATGERSAVIALRRYFDHWPASHVCTFVNDACDCGSTR